MNMTVLIVEDEPLMSEVIARTIEPLTSRITKVTTIRECMIELLKGIYNVVILDLLLPDSTRESSLRSIREIKKTEPRPGVVVISGVPDPMLKEKCEQAGADAFVPKTDGFTKQAVLIAIHVAALKLPASSYKSDSFLKHVEMLDSMVHTGGK